MFELLARHRLLQGLPIEVIQHLCRDALAQNASAGQILKENVHIQLEDQAIVNIDLLINHLRNADLVVPVFAGLVEEIGDLTPFAFSKRNTAWRLRTVRTLITLPTI